MAPVPNPNPDRPSRGAAAAAAVTTPATAKKVLPPPPFVNGPAPFVSPPEVKAVQPAALATWRGRGLFLECVFWSRSFKYAKYAAYLA